MKLEVVKSCVLSDFRIIFLSGNFNDSLRDAKLAIDLDPCYIKAIERGKF